MRCQRSERRCEHRFELCLLRCIFRCAFMLPRVPLPSLGIGATRASTTMTLKNGPPLITGSSHSRVLRLTSSTSASISPLTQSSLGSNNYPRPQQQQHQQQTLMMSYMDSIRSHHHLMLNVSIIVDNLTQRHLHKGVSWIPSYCRLSVSLFRASHPPAPTFCHSASHFSILHHARHRRSFPTSYRPHMMGGQDDVGNAR